MANKCGPNGIKSAASPLKNRHLLYQGPDKPSLSLIENIKRYPQQNISASELEKTLTRQLSLECPCQNEVENNEETDDVVHFAARMDAHWLKCQSSHFLPLMTILGIYEDEGTLDLPVSIFHSVIESTPPFILSQKSTSLEPPHSLWKRTATQSRDPTFESTSSLYVRWVHAENYKDSEIVASPAEAWSFLTSLLGNEHSSSPWTSSGHEVANNDGRSEGHDEKGITADIIILQLHKMNRTLRDFRVSDASPAWFFHGYAYIDATYSDKASNVLFIYKRLKSRTMLSCNHPIDDSVAMNGCLWEVLPTFDGKFVKDADTKKSLLQKLTESPSCRLVSPPYLNLEQEYGSTIANGLFSSQALAIFRQEALAIPKWTPWPETQHYSVGPNGETTWTVFPLCYCFPSHDVSQRTWIEHTKEHCPKTCALIESVLGETLRTALFSHLNPETTLEAHTGWADLANSVLRLHIPLVVPELCGTWVDGCVETHKEGRPLLFDDSKIHRAFNYSTKGRIVLILDLERPRSLPKGYATGGHSDELDAFIAQMGVPK